MITQILKQSVINNLAQIVPEFTQEEITAATQKTATGQSPPYVYIVVVLVVMIILVAVVLKRKSRRKRRHYS